MSKEIGKLTGLTIKTGIVSEVHSSPNIEMLGKEVDSLFVKDKSMTTVPVTGNPSAVSLHPSDIHKEANLIPRAIPKQKDENIFAFSDKLARGNTSAEYETFQQGHSVKTFSQEMSLDGSVLSKWEGKNQDNISYKATGKETGTAQEINSRGAGGEFEAHSTLIRNNNEKKETLYVKNNKNGTETTLVISARGKDEEYRGNLKNLEGDNISYELRKSGGNVLEETLRTEFAEGGIELRETVKEQKEKIKTLAFYSEKHMENFSAVDFTEEEAIKTIAKNIREGRISTARIKKEIMEDSEYSLFDEGSLIELIEQEYSLSLDGENRPVSFKITKKYDKEGNLTGEEEEETLYRGSETGNGKEHVFVKRTFEYYRDERIQTGEEEFIDRFPGAGKKNIQYSKTSFQGGKRHYKRTDMMQKGDVSEEYKDLSSILETGRKLLFARLLEEGSGELSIRHHSDSFYNSIEEEDREVRTTVYKYLRNPSVLLARIDILKGYTNVLPLWVLLVSSSGEINVQFLFEGMKHTTFIDRFDKTGGYHNFKGTLRDEELGKDTLRQIANRQLRLDEEVMEKRRKEERTSLEQKFSDRAVSLFNIHTDCWISLKGSLKEKQKNDEVSLADFLENILSCLLRYLNPENNFIREGALEKRHIFLPIISTGDVNIENLLGYKFGIDLIFLLWEMLNIIGQAEGKDRFASIKI